MSKQLTANGPAAEAAVGDLIRWSGKLQRVTEARVNAFGHVVIALENKTPRTLRRDHRLTFVVEGVTVE